MTLEEIDRETWEKYEESRKHYETNPISHKLTLVCLLLQSVVVAIFVFGTLFYLICTVLENPAEHSRLFSFLILNGIISIGIYIYVLTRYPWRGMFYLAPDKYPELYRKVNWIAKLRRAPKIHRIYLHEDFNASVAAASAIIPGLRQNVLMLGYPLLCALSSKALIAILAHELGHVASNHHSRNAIFYRLELFWSSLQLGIFSLVLNLWARYFIAKLEVLRFPMRYQDELVADRYIAEKFGMNYQLEGMTQLAAKGQFMVKDQRIVRAIILEDDPNYAELLRDCVRSEHTEAEWRAILTELQDEMVFSFDEHPSFRERTGNRSVDELLPFLTAAPDALEKLTGDGSELKRYLNEHLQHKNTGLVRELRKEYQKAKNTVQNFSRETAGQEAEWVEMIQALELLEFLEHRNDMQELLDEAISRYPDSAALRGKKIILQLKETIGETEQQQWMAELETLLETDPSKITDWHDTMMQYYVKHNMPEKVKKMLDLRKMESSES